MTTVLPLKAMAGEDWGFVGEARDFLSRPYIGISSLGVPKMRGTDQHISILRVDGVFGTFEVSNFMPLGSDSRGSERVIRLPDCSLRPFVSKFRVVSTRKLKDTTVDIGSLLISSTRYATESAGTYIPSSQDTDEWRDEVGSETLKHLWWHSGSEHGSGSELTVSLVFSNGGRSLQAR
jgi:hypothetical protein